MSEGAAVIDMPTPTPRELEILMVLWEHGPSSVRDVHRHLSPSGDVALLRLGVQQETIRRWERFSPLERLSYCYRRALVASAGHQHLAIAAAIAAGDPVAVVAAAEEHLADVEERMLRRLV